MMKIYFDYKGSRFMKMALLSFFTIYVERNFHGYAAFMMLFAASILLSFSVSFEQGEKLQWPVKFLNR